MKLRSLLSRMKFTLYAGVIACMIIRASAAEFTPAPQRFQQEVASFYEKAYVARLPVQLIESPAAGGAGAFVTGRWHDYRDGRWSLNESLSPKEDSQFAFAGANGQRVEVPVPWREVRQILRAGATNFIVAEDLFSVSDGKPASLGWAKGLAIRQIAASPDGRLYIGSNWAEAVNTGPPRGPGTFVILTRFPRERRHWLVKS